MKSPRFDRILWLLTIVGLALWGAMQLRQSHSIKRSLQAGTDFQLLSGVRNAILGDLYPREIRHHLIENPMTKVEIVPRASQIRSPQPHHLVTSGLQIELIDQSASQITLFNPAIPTESCLQSLDKCSLLRIYWGDLHHSQARIYWQQYSSDKRHVFFLPCQGYGAEFPQWIDLALAPFPPLKHQSDLTQPISDTSPPLELNYLPVSISSHPDLQHQTDDFLIVDCRSNLFYSIGHLPTAVNLPSPTLESLLTLQANDPRPLLLYTQGGHFPEIEPLLADFRHSTNNKLHVYTGGWEEWKRLAYPSESEY